MNLRTGTKGVKINAVRHDTSPIKLCSAFVSSTHVTVPTAKPHARLPTELENNILFGTSYVLQQLLTLPTCADGEWDLPESGMGSAETTPFDCFLHRHLKECNRINASDIRVFLSRYLYLTKWPHATVVVAVALIVRFRQRLIDEPIIKHYNYHVNWRKLVLIALLISQKILDDSPLANSEMPKVISYVHSVHPRHTLGLWHLDLKSINFAEAAFLGCVAWNVHVTQVAYSSILEELVSLSEPTR